MGRDSLEEQLDELLSDDYNDDPIGHETKWGEGWTREDWRSYFENLGYIEKKFLTNLKNLL